ncbi:hypothetical protein [Arthrobacter sp. C152]
MNAELAAEGQAKHCHHNGVSGGGLIKEHAVALDRNGKTLLDRVFSQDAAQLLSIAASLAARTGPCCWWTSWR